MPVEEGVAVGVSFEKAAALSAFSEEGVAVGVSSDEAVVLSAFSEEGVAVGVSFTVFSTSVARA